MPTKTLPPSITNATLIDIIRKPAGGAAGLGKMRALSALRLSRSTKKVEVFSAVLADRQELTRYKHMAIFGLYELGGERAEQALIDNVPNADAQTAATVAEALGRIGSPSAIRITRELEAMASPDSKPRAAFATSLLAYRHNLPGHEVAAAGQLAMIAAGSEVNQIKVSRAVSDEANLAMAALEREPVGVNLDLERAQYIECPPNIFLLVWNRQFSGSQLRNLRTRKGVLGLLFRRSRFEDAYALSAFVLATPKDDGLQLTLHRSNGIVQFAGLLVLDANEARFTISSVERPGAVAIEFSGAIRDGQLNVASARSALTASRKREPKPVPADLSPADME